MSTIDDTAPILPLAQQVGDAVSDLRHELHLKQQEVADRAGISRQHLSEIENGKVDVSVSVLNAIATVLGRTLAELLVDVDMG